MKAMCIKNGAWKWLLNDSPFQIPGPKFGEPVTIVDTIICKTNVYYKLMEYDNPRGGGWDSKQFLLCSNIDETELVNHKEQVA